MVRRLTSFGWQTSYIRTWWWEAWEISVWSFYKNINLIHEGFILMTYSPSKVYTSLCDYLWIVKIQHMNLEGTYFYHRRWQKSFAWPMALIFFKHSNVKQRKFYIKIYMYSFFCALSLFSHSVAVVLVGLVTEYKWNLIGFICYWPGPCMYWS